MTDVAVRPVEAPVTVEAPHRWRARLTGDGAQTFAAVLAWHTVLIAVAMLFQTSHQLEIGYPPGLPLTPLSHLLRYDGTWFLDIIAHDGYDLANRPWLAAFYPLYPLLVWTVDTVTFGQLGILGAGQLVNLLASWAAATALLKIARQFGLGRPAQWLTVALMITAPPAFFLHVLYSEALFCALGFWAYLFALRRQWAWMGLCLIPLTATRITAVLFVGLCLLEFLRAGNWRPRRLLSWPALWFPAAFLGFGGYLLYLQVIAGDPTVTFAAQRMWTYHVFNPNVAGTIAREIDISTGVLLHGPLTNQNLVDHLLPGAALLMLAAMSLYLLHALRGAALPLAIFGLASIVMFTLNSNIISVHRYVLPCLSIYLGLALLTERRPTLRPAVYGLMFTHTLVLGFLYSAFVAGTWSG